MIYRELGITGKKVSAIGLGCEHLDGKPYEQVKETVDSAIEHGVNIIDVFMPGKTVRENIAAAIGNRRSKVMIQGHIGSTDVNQQYDISRDMPVVKRYFEELLRVFGTIDFGMLAMVDSDEDYNNIFETEFINYAQQLKKQGDIRHIGFSSHNPVTAMKAIRTGIPEIMMFSINPAFDMLPSSEYIFDHFETGFGVELFRGIDPVRAELYRLCTQKQIGITVMKTLGGGKLLSPDHTPFAEPLTVPQCVHYALSRPGVASTLVGCQTRAEVEEAMRYFELEDSEKDYTKTLTTVRNDFRGSCVYCNHCQPCPTDIDIATVNKYLDIARLDKSQIPPSIRSHYSSLSANGNACIHCGDCEKRCPFGVSIMDNMTEAEHLLGSPPLPI